MKKLIAIAVVFVLVAGAAFAVDLGGTVIGTVNVVQGDSGKDDAGDPNPIGASATLNRVRIDGSGEAGEGAFGGYFRYDNGGFSGNAWWKPIDQFKLLVGSNGGDGFYGKEGVTGWMFQQTAYDTGVGLAAGNIWGGGYGGTLYRNAFFGGDGGGNALRLEITPLDMLGLNLFLPFFDGGEVGDVFMKIIAQVDLKFDFGNIAFTYRGGKGYKENSSDYTDGTDPGDATVITDGDDDYFWSGTAWTPITKGTGTKGYDDPGSLFVYYGGSFDALSIDFGFGFHFPKAGGDYAQPISIGLGIKYATDAFGVKFRTVASLGGDDKTTALLAEVMPYFSLGDNLTAFVSAGLAITAPEDVDAVTGWHLNPYIQVGEEWGAKFLAGVHLWSNGQKVGDDPAIVNWAIPIALIVSF